MPEPDRPIELRIIDLWEHYIMAAIRDCCAARPVSGARYFDAAFLLEELLLPAFPPARTMRAARERIERQIEIDPVWSDRGIAEFRQRFGLAPSATVIIGDWRTPSA